MYRYLRKFELALAALFALFLMIEPYGLFFGPLFYAAVLIVIYSRNTSETMDKMRRENLGYQNRMLSLSQTANVNVTDSGRGDQ